MHRNLHRRCIESEGKTKAISRARGDFTHSIIKSVKYLNFPRVYNNMMQRLFWLLNKLKLSPTQSLKQVLTKPQLYKIDLKQCSHLKLYTLHFLYGLDTGIVYNKISTHFINIASAKTNHDCFNIINSSNYSIFARLSFEKQT